MNHLVEIICKNNGERKLYPKGITLKEISEDLGIKLRFPVLGALVNNKLRELDYDFYKPKTIEFIDFTCPTGFRMYARSAAFILYKAVKDLYPQAKLRIEHSVSNGAYCEIDGIENCASDVTVAAIKTRMLEIVQEDIPFTRSEKRTEEAIQMFDQAEHNEKVMLFKYREQLYTSVYGLGDVVNYFFGYLVPSTGYITQFDLTRYFCGLLLRIPEKNSPWQLNGLKRQDKLFKIFREHKKWANILGVSYVGQLNQATAEKRDNELIKISEALHEKKTARIADKIYKHKKDIKIILIAGPSSSGKTTFSKRLSVQLMVLGLQPVQISLDNYFIDRELTPRDENGDYNFETIHALDIGLFNQNLVDLIEGKEAFLPKFDFTSGKQTRDALPMKLGTNQLLVIEGIHGLNPELTANIPVKAKYKIFVSALTQISIDGQNPIPSTDNRLIRRIVRDYRFRNYSALDTLSRWESVRKGEEEYIFPFQENADAMFNSALLYELAVLKTFAEPIIKAVPENRPEYAEAQRLLKFVSYFRQISAREIPPTSILREFLGGSSFIY